MSDNVEALIEVASQLKDVVIRLGEAYDAMPGVIEQEHKAIRASDFAAVQAAVRVKEQAGEKIEAVFGELTRATERLARHVTVPRRPRALKECVAVLRELAAEATADESLGALSSQVLQHQVEGFAQVAQAFEEKYTRIKPQIEANRALVQTVLSNFQESYQFWLEVAEQVASAYNAQGVQQAKGRNSGFVSKA